MKTVTGNVLDLADIGEFDVVIHGCNCQHTMGWGIAGQIAIRYKEAVEADLDTPRSPQKLGGFSKAVINTERNDFFLFNAYTQVYPGNDARLAAIKESFTKIRGWLESNNLGNLRIAYPKIGCGIGGLRWEDVAPVIDEVFEGLDHTVVVLPS